MKLKKGKTSICRSLVQDLIQGGGKEDTFPSQQHLKFSFSLHFLYVLATIQSMKCLLSENYIYFEIFSLHY